MTVSVSNRTLSAFAGGLAIVAMSVFGASVAPTLAADAPALKLRATVVAAGAPSTALSIELFRWSTDEERAPLLTALSAPPPAPPAPAAPAAPPAAGRAAAAGRGARGGRAAGPATPATPMERLTTAVKAAPTLGFIWGTGPTGYSVKYAWHIAPPEGGERIVLVTDRRIGANEVGWPVPSGPAADADFTVIEMRLGGKGTGEAKSSLSAPVVVDAVAKTLAIDGYAAAPALLKVTR